MKLLCLSEDESLGRRVCAEAKRLGWCSVFIAHRETIQRAVVDHNPDLLLIDIHGLADLGWWEKLALPFKQPMIVLNDEITEEFMAKALDLGADAFLPKSLFSSRHFEARIRSLLRRQGLGQTKRFIERLHLLIDSEHYAVEVRGAAIALTMTEFKILRELATEEVKVVPRREIHARVFGGAQLTKRSLDVHICTLRKKIRRQGLDVDSVRGVGYRLNPCST